MDRYKQFLFGLLTGLAAVGVIVAISRRPTGKPVELLPPPESPGARVNVTGAVASPGVYELPPGSIVQDALEAAGGTLPDADVTSLNLAAILEDGQQVVVPARPTPAPPTAVPLPTNTLAPGQPSSTPAPTSTGGLVNINTATLEELDTLPGIGPSTAQKIIDYRTANGPFKTVDELDNVSGIGPATMEKLRPLITVGP